MAKVNAAFIILIVAVAALHLVVSAPTNPHGGPPGLAKKKLKLPPGQTLEKLHKQHGLDDEDFKDMKENVIFIKEALYELSRHKKMDATMAAELDEFFDDTVLTKEQSAILLEQVEEKLRKANNNRHKRKMFNFDNYPIYKWPSTDSGATTVIPYKYDGTHATEDIVKIEEAMLHWETRTCIRFQQLDADVEYTDNHIIFTNANTGCWSYIGSVNVIPQTVNLQNPGCLNVAQLGTAVHELGHAIGFFHEHARPDRNTYITVNEDNIYGGNLYSFRIRNTVTVDTNGVAYDYGSIMHYSPRSFSIDTTSRDAITANDPLYQKTMGQHSGLSFFDIKLANIEYCSATCPTLSCLHGGIVNPNDCAVCQCPDGYGGALCDEVAGSDAACPMENAGSDGVIDVTSEEEQCITLRNYVDRTQCNWKLTAASGCYIDMYFQQTSEFRVFCSTDAGESICNHWVEIKYKGGLDTRGPRFCCYGTPADVLTTEGNEAVVTFRSDFTSRDWAGYRVGFKLCFKLESNACLQ